MKMMNLKRLILPGVILISLLFAGSLEAASRIKDVAAFEGVRDNQLFGYGLVVGLAGTGDGTQTYFSTQTIANMLERNGITIDPGRMRTKNVAAVMVTANLPPFARQGSTIDVVVSSLGDAKSLQGGVLIMTPLQAADSQVYAVAQGQIALGGYSAASGGGGARTQVNHPTVGRISNGALVEKEVEVNLSGMRRLNLVLNRNDFTSASRAVNAINDTLGFDVAEALDGRTIAIAVPSHYSNRLIEFMAAVENARVEMDNVARVVLNERTGTVVIGKNVSVSEVSIIHGTLSLQVGTIFSVSQPNPFSMGETMLVPEETLTVVEEPARTATIRDGATVEEIVRALNDIGASPRDVIAILQAIKAQGALQAEIEIL
jgi:flagellar P-ring protein precursor FlgI